MRKQLDVQKLIQQGTTVARQVPLLIAPILLLFAYAYLNHLYHLYDWGHPFTKLIVLASFAAMIVLLMRHSGNTISVGFHIYWIEMIALIFILVIILSQAIQTYKPFLNSPPSADNGYTTQTAATMLLKGENPYQSENIAVLNDNPKQWGYKYGPAMIIGYLPSAKDAQNSIKKINLFYLVITVIALAYIVYQPSSVPLKNTASILFAVTALLIPTRLWYELFQTGVNDIFPVLLLLIAILFIKQHKWLPAGTLVGLAFSAKFALALPFIVLLLRKKPPRYLYTGLALGMLPLLVFLIWDPAALINNAFLFHLTKQPDSTSLYTITPPALHFIFPVIQLIAISYAIFRNYNRAIDYRRLTVHFTLLLLIIEVTFKEIHGNHLIFFLPPLALILSWYRYTNLNIRATIILNKLWIQLRAPFRQ